jgi:sugar phosphate isomerase/epimerase
MASGIDRRGFLTQSIGAAAGLALAAAGAGERERARAIEPIARNGEAKFKFSMAAYSYRDLLNGESPKLTLADFISECAKLNLEGTELTSYYFPDPVTPDFLRQLRRQCFRLGLDVSGTAVGNDFGVPPGEKRIAQIEGVKLWVDNAAILGAPVIRVFAGHRHESTTEAQSHSLIVSALEECCEYAGRQGVHLALENHGGPTATAEGLLAFVRDVQSPWFGVNLDTGNFHTEDIYGDIAKVAPYALNVQVKLVVSGPDGKREPTDYTRLAQILREANYRGYVVLEFEESGDPREECPKAMEALRAGFEKA